MFSLSLSCGDEHRRGDKRDLIPTRITLDLSEWKMILDMFATIDEMHGLGGDMLRLYEKIKVIEPLVKLLEP